MKISNLRLSTFLFYSGAVCVLYLLFLMVGSVYYPSIQKIGILGEIGKALGFYFACSFPAALVVWKLESADKKLPEVSATTKVVRSGTISVVIGFMIFAIWLVHALNKAAW